MIDRSTCCDCAYCTLLNRLHRKCGRALKFPTGVHHVFSGRSWRKPNGVFIVLGDVEQRRLYISPPRPEFFSERLPKVVGFRDQRCLFLG